MSQLPVSSAAVGVGRVCYRHTDAGASQTCTTCRRSICDGCVSVGNNFAVVCSSCANAAHRRTQVITAGAVGLALVVVGGAFAFIMTRPPLIEYGEHRIGIENAEARIAGAPCSGQSTLDLVDLLNKEGDYVRVIKVVDEFRGHCAPVNRLYWESYGARMQVQDFKGAADDAGRLIDADPDDGDFWWWRAKARRKDGDLKGAEADLRKSAEVTGKGAFYAVLDLADLLEQQQRGCEAVPLLAQLTINKHDQAETNGAMKTLSRLVREGGCPDPLAALPKNATTVASLCSTLPAKIVFDEGRAASGFEFALAGAWQARVGNVAQGKVTACRAEVAQNPSSEILGALMKSYSARLSCSGLAPTTSTTLSISALKAEEAFIGLLIDQSIKKWCLQ